jgi:5-methyltetrahydropteroyltriglutamate--homocysteine methyltransferase
MDPGSAACGSRGSPMSSSHRILTTHVGSLPRPREVLDLLFAQDRDEAVDAGAFDAAVQRGVDEAVQRQADAGIDIVSDGETSKISYATYIRHRLSGFDGDSARPTPQDLDDFPAYRDRLVAEGHSPTYRRPVCCGPVSVKNVTLVANDITRLERAIARVDVVDGFITAVSPGTVGVFHPNRYYRSHDAYVTAVASALRPEYEEIVGAGFILQIDCPDLAMGRHSRFKDVDDAQFLRYAEKHVEALNEALANVAADRVRLHVCWGNYEGPHTHDMPLVKILPLLFEAKPMALVIEGANPRHEHEWEVWRRHRLPDDKILIPGVIDTSTNYVEHPELVAQRIDRYARLVGRDRVMAGTDCGMGTFAGFGPVHPDIAWAKLRSLVAGARVASRNLWKPAIATV